VAHRITPGSRSSAATGPPAYAPGPPPKRPPDGRSGRRPAGNLLKNGPRGAGARPRSARRRHPHASSSLPGVAGCRDGGYAAVTGSRTRRKPPRRRRIRTPSRVRGPRLRRPSNSKRLERYQEGATPVTGKGNRCGKICNAKCSYPWRVVRRLRGIRTTAPTGGPGRAGPVQGPIAIRARVDAWLDTGERNGRRSATGS